MSTIGAKKIPVQVNGRIVDLVDYSRAEAMSCGANVKAVRAHCSRQIVRLILTPREAGDGRANERSGHADSRKATYVESLFTDHEPDTHMMLVDGTKVPRVRPGVVAGYPFVYQLKHSSTFARASVRREGTSDPTTTPTPSPAGRKVDQWLG